MFFDRNAYTVEETTLFGQTVRYRAWRNIPYVEKPVVPEYQQLNLFAPEALFVGESVNGYTLSTAPVFVPNTVGGMDMWWRSRPFGAAVRRAVRPRPVL